MGLSYDSGGKIAPIGGAELLHALLILLERPEEFANRLAELEEARDEANAAIESVGPAKEIARLRTLVREQLADAQDSLAEARQTAEAIKADAGKLATRMRDESVLYRREAEEMREKAEIDAKVTVERARQRAAAIAAQSETMRTELLDRTAKLDNRESAVRVREEAAEAAQAKADAARAEYEEKLAGFRRIAGG